nr:leukotoxin LktA family filamentous adhesin [Novosphingobium sp. FKTRR1]
MVGAASIAAALAANGVHAQAVDVTASSGGASVVALQSGGNAAVVTTSRVVGGTGFNRFDHFNIGTGQAATLVVPTGANNLVNLIRDPSTINGTVSSVLGAIGGQVGGNVFLVVPSGLVIGTTGIINTGRLIVRGTQANAGSGDPSLADVFGGAPAANVTINGRISAPGGVDIHASTVSVGASGVVETGAAGLARIGNTAALQNSLVSTQGLPSGQAIVTTASGGIAIVAGSTIALAAKIADNPATAANEAQPGALFDARPVSALPTLPAGVSLQAPSITIGGRIRTWDGTGSSPAADITLTATDSKVYANTFAPNSPFYGMPQATAGISIDGSVIGGNIAASATATGTTNPADGTKAVVALDKLAGALGSAGLAKLTGNTLGIGAFVSLVSAKSAISIGAGASLTASKDITLAAGSAASSVASASAKAGKTASGQAAIAASVSQTTSNATITVGTAQAGASLIADGAIRIGASSDPRAKTSVIASSTGDAVAAAIAYNEVNADAGVTVSSGSKLDGKSIAVSATIAQADPTAGIVTSATGRVFDTSPGGGVAAVTQEAIHSHVDVGGTIGSARTATVTIAANTTISHNKTSATTTSKTGTDNPAVTPNTANTNFASMIGGLLRLSTTDPKTPKPGTIGTSADPANRLTAAVAVLQANETANARITGTITATGQVSVTGQVSDQQVRNNAQASAAAALSVNGVVTTVSGAAAWGTYVYSGTADIAGTVNAGSLNVTSLVDRPVGIADPVGTLVDQADVLNAPDNFNAVLADLGFAKDVFATISPLLTPKSGLFGSYAGASTDSDSSGKAALGGSFAYDSIDSTSRAWIDPSSQITIAGPQAGASVIDAETSIVLLNLAGPKLFGSKSGGTAGGGAVTYNALHPVTTAGIGDGVIFIAPDRDLSVIAKSAIDAFSLSPVAGKGKSTTLSGAFAVNQVDGATHAIISSAAQLAIGAGALREAASTDLQLWAVAGTLAWNKADGTQGSSDTSVGVSGALNYVSLDTQAAVAAAHDEFDTTGPAIAAATKAGVASGNVSVTAQTTGSVNAVSVAGVRDSSDPEVKPGLKDKLSATFNPSKGALSAPMTDELNILASGFLGAIGLQKYSDQLKANYTTRKDAASAGNAAATDPATKTPPTDGWGVAGSAGVNLTSLATKVNISKAKFTKAANAASATFLAKATERADTLAITGGATLANGVQYSGSSTLVAGAYGVSYSNNATAVAIDQSVLAGFDAVTANAAANGLRIGAGLALAADTTKTTDGRIFASSASVLVANDSVGAAITDGAVTGTGKGDVSVLAFDGRTLGAGAGGLSWGTQSGFGAALTLLIDKAASGKPTTALLARTPVSGFVNLSVQALDAARLVGVAAAGALSASADQNNGALAASISINDVALGTSALIDLGDTGTGLVNITGALTVAAGEYAANDPAAQVSRTSCSINCDAAESLLANFAIASTTFGSDDPVQAKDLPSGAAVVSVAIPVASARGKATGLGLSVNLVNNDRTAAIIGGAAASGSTIKAGSLALRTVDRATILSLAAGLSTSSNQTGIMGSLAYNQIGGTASASLARSATATAGPVIETGTAGGSVAPISVTALADGRIYSLSGAIGIGKSAAGGLAVSVNSIARDGSGPAAGLDANVDGVTLKGNPGLAVNAASTETILSGAIAGSLASGNSLAGSASTNAIAPKISARADRLAYANAVTGDLAVTASDSASIRSLALTAALSSSSNALGAGISANRISTNVLASLTPASAISVRNLLVQSQSAATTQLVAVGLGLAAKFNGVGSMAVNQTSAEADALLTLNGFNVTATGSVGVLATRDSSIDAAAGAVALGSKSAVGASLVLNDVSGGAQALVTGTGAASVTALGGGDGFAVRTGDLSEALQQFSLPDVVPDSTSTTGASNASLQHIKPATTQIHGVAINANSTHSTRTLAITGAVSGSGFAAAVTAVVGNVGGNTQALASGVQFNVGNVGVAKPVAEPVALDIRAGTAIDTASFAGAAAGSNNVGVGAPVVSDGLSAQTTARMAGGGVNTTGNVTVRAASRQAATALVVAGAIGGNVGAAVSGVSPRFAGVTTAAVDDPTAVTILGSGGLAINADSDSRGLATFGTLALGKGAGAATVVVVTDDDQTQARYKSTKRVSVSAPSVNVTANGRLDARVAGASAAAGLAGALVGNGVGIVNRQSVAAQASGLSYNNGQGTVAVTANQIANFQPIVGQVAATAAITSGAAALGAVVVLSQAKVDATLIDPLVTAKQVSVNAYGASGVDALQLGLAGGLGGSIGANVTYIGIGEVADTGALFSTSGDSSANGKVATNAGATGSGNANLAMLGGGSGETTAQQAAAPGLDQLAGSGSAHVVAGADGTRDATGTVQTSSRDQFMQVGVVTTAPGADDAAASRVRAQVLSATPGLDDRVTTGALSVVSSANLVSKSSNFQGAASLASGSAAIAITRNAANSIARIGAGVTATGVGNASTAQVQALTGQDTSRLTGGITNPSKAAEALVVAGAVGALTASIGLADIKLQTVSLAESLGKIGFGTLTIKSGDSSDAAAQVYGAAAGGAALNVAVANVTKEGTVGAQIAGKSASTITNVIASGGGSTSAYALAASGGNLLDGNAAVALATDRRTVDARVAEGTVISSNTLLVDASSSPVISAASDGIAVSGGIAMGASVALANADATVEARVGEGANISCATFLAANCTLTVRAALARPTDGANITARARGSAGGGLAAANATLATASDNGNVAAIIGADLNGVAGAPTVLAGPALTVLASRTLAQTASADGLTAAGLLSIGVQSSSATSAGSVDAALLNVDGSQQVLNDPSTNRALVNASGGFLRNPDATVSATSLDLNTATVRAGAGAVGAGVAASATTDASGIVTTTIAPDAAYTFRAGTLTATATAQTDYHSEADATQASIVGGSGSTTGNTVDTTAHVLIGKARAGAATGGNSTIRASQFVISAQNTVGVTGSDGGFARGAGGGAAAGAAAQVTNRVTQHSTVDVLDGVTLRQYGDASQNLLAMTINAGITTARSHSTALQVGGVMVLPFARVDSTFNASSLVTIGANALLRADGGIGIGTTAHQTIADTSAVQIYGLAGIGGGSASTTDTAAGLVTVADGATIESLSDVHLTPGIAADGLGRDNVSISDQTDVFNQTLVPITVDHDAHATGTLANRLVIGKAVVRSARDVTFSALAEGLAATAVGTGHNPYLALVSKSDSGGTADMSTAGSIALNGSQITAGFLANRKIAITDTADGGWQGIATDFDGTETLTRTIVADAKGKITGDTLASSAKGPIATPDRDRLGLAQLSSRTVSALDVVGQQISSLTAQVQAAGLAVPGDPNALPVGPDHEKAAAALAAAAAQSALVAKLSAAYDTRAALASAGSTNTAGIMVDNLLAAGGSFAINTATITGSGSTIVANASPTIAINSTSARNLILGNLFIPAKPSGAVTYGGPIGETDLNAIASVRSSGPNDTVEGLIDVTDGAQFGAKSDLLVFGPIANVGGTFKALVNNGNFSQFGDVQVGKYDVTVPNGLFNVSTTGDFTMGVPISLYYGRLGLSLNDAAGLDCGTGGSTDGCATNANQLALLVQSYIAEQTFDVTDIPGIDALRQAMKRAFNLSDAQAADPILTLFEQGFVENNGGQAYYTRLNSAGQLLRTAVTPKSSGAPYTAGAGSSATIFASCTQWCELESNDNQLSSVAPDGGNLFVPFLWGYGDTYPRKDYPGGYYTQGSTFSDPVIVRRITDLPENGNAANAVSKLPATASDGGLIRANQVRINARFVNVSGSIVAGPEKQRTLAINSQLVNSVGLTIQDAMALDPNVHVGSISAPLQSLNVASGNIGARYVVTGLVRNGPCLVSGAGGCLQQAVSSTTGYIQLDDVDAGAGGVIDITGRILNTNPLGGGELKVLDGFANISVVNNAPIDLHLGTINAGTDVSGLIKLTDLHADGSVEQTTYRDTPGLGVTMSHAMTTKVAGSDQFTTRIDADVTYQPGVGETNSSQGSEAPLIYDPSTRGAAYYVTTEGRTITRDVSITDDSVPKTDGKLPTPGTLDVLGGAASPWRFGNATQQPQSGSFVDVAASGTDPLLIRALGGGTPDFVQTVGGTVTHSQYDTVPFGTNDDFRQNMTWEIPDQINVTLTTAARATYPIKVVFDNGYGTGGVNVVSTQSSVVVGGRITYGGGDVGITAGENIVGTPSGLIYAHGFHGCAGSASPADCAPTFSSGSIGSANQPLAVTIAGSALGDPVTGLGKVAGGTVTAQATGGDVFLTLNSSTATAGDLDAVALLSVAATGKVVITSGTGLVGIDGIGPNIVGQEIDLTTAGSVGGFNPYSGSGTDPLRKPALTLTVGNGGLWINAGGDITVQGALKNDGTDINDVMRLGAIVSTRDVQIRAPGSIVALDTTTTVNQDKLARFLAATQALQLAPGATCSGAACPTIDPTRLTSITDALRNQARAAYDTIIHANGLAQTEALDIAARIDKLNGLAASGVVIGRDGKVVYDPAKDTGKTAAGFAASLTGRNGLSTADITGALQTYANSVIALVGVNLPNLSGSPDKAATVSALVRSQGKAAAEADAVGKLQLVDQLRTQGVQIDTSGKVTLAGSANVAPGSALAVLAVNALQSQTNALKPATGAPAITPVATPTPADVLRGLQAYVDSVTGKIKPLFGGTLPTLVGLGTTAAQLSFVDSKITATGITAYTSAQTADAQAVLTQQFGVLPTSRASIDTLAFSSSFLAARTDGATWRQSQLDFQVPSTAFVPVADTQFETRKPVITARNLTLIAGNSIGNFEAPEAFRFTSAGLVDAAGKPITDPLQKQLAAAYLASAGPGDLTATVTGSPATLVTFVSRRDQPLPLDVDGVINAFAATNYVSRTTSWTAANADQLAGDIFLNDVNTMTIGSIVSLKPVTGARRTDCNSNPAVLLSSCDSRIRLTANAITGVTQGAAQLTGRVYVNSTLTSANVTDASGRALIMGGLIRLEASNGDLQSSDGTAIQIDAQGLETVRAAGNARLIKRTPGLIGSSDFSSQLAYRNGNDLTVGDVFAGKTFALDNLSGSLLVGAVPSSLASENRNGRIVAGAVALRAAGDIGGSGITAAGLPARFDIQTPQLDKLAAGFDYAAAPTTGPATTLTFDGGGQHVFSAAELLGSSAIDPYAQVSITITKLPTGASLVLNGANGLQFIKVGAKIPLAAISQLRFNGFSGLGTQTLGYQLTVAAGAVGSGSPPAGTAAGSAWLDLRSATRIGGNVASLIGARGSIDIGKGPGANGLIDLESAVKVGGTMAIATAGNFAIGAGVNVSKSGAAAPASCATDPAPATCLMTLSSLNLAVGGAFNLTTGRSIEFGALAAGGGKVESTLGSITVDRGLTGSASAAAPFTLKGSTGVFTHDILGGALALISTNGNIDVAGKMNASSITMTGKTTGVDGAIDTSNLVIVADGDVSLESTITADSLHVSVTGDLELSHSITLRSPAGHTQSVLVAGGAVTLGDDAVISGTPSTLLSITGASIGFAPTSTIRGVDTTIVATSGPALIGTIEGGAFSLRARGDIALGSLAASSAEVVSTRGNIDFGGSVRITSGGLAGSGRLAARAAGAITIAAPFSAGGGISLAARDITSAGSGYLASNAPIVLRADRMALTVADLQPGSAPVRLNVSGFSAPFTNEATFAFSTPRLLDFTTLKVARLRIDDNGEVRFAPWTECELLPVAAGNWLAMGGGPAGRCAQPPALDPVGSQRIESKPALARPATLSHR